MKPKHWITAFLVILAVLALAACQTGGPTPAPTQAPVPTQAPCPPAAECPECPACPEAAEQDVPFQEAWAASPHADAEAAAFTHWNEEDPAEIPADCAKCHSTDGYIDFLGEDGSAFGTVDKAAPIGTVVSCSACHNPTAQAMTSVVFPSGAEITGLADEARCMQCHQGRASGVAVDNRIEELNLAEDLDTPNEELAFINIHYYAAAATLYGNQAMGGYQYAGQSYDPKFEHVEGFDTCIGCHNSHTTELKIEACAGCHEGVTSAEDIRNVRMQGSVHDYDGDGDVEEGLAFEVQGLQEKLLQAIQAYATEKAGTAITYDVHAYPYFFIDTNGDGQTSEDEAVFPNGYKSWTGRLLRAAYNYQTSLKDPGSYAHNGKYIIQLLTDSINDLNEVVSAPVDMSAAVRIDAGHFAGSEFAFRDWDESETGMVPATCTKCHTAGGLPFFIANGVNISTPPTNGLSCATCHNDLTTFSRFEIAEVRFPSGAMLSFDSVDANLCLNCHQGRESKVSVDQAITRAAVGDDEVSEALSFRNPHYFATGGTLFGTQAKGAYEFNGQTYNSRFVHVEAFDTCIECHDAHNLEVPAQTCSGCHSGASTTEELRNIRMTEGDFDGDGDSAEGIAGEVETMHTALYAALQAYASETAGTALAYDSHAYPYFFNDTNANGTADPDEAVSSNRYASWTPTLLRAAYNYQWVAKDPGAFAHNGAYILQILYDSLQAVGADVSGMTRPAVEAAPAQ